MACGAHVLAYAIGRPAGAQQSGRARQPTRLRSITRCQFGDGRANLPKQRRIQFSGLPRDALAGLLLAAIAIPEQLATARLAGMPPEAGLLTFAAGAIGFAVFGTNRFLSAGADSTIAPIFAGGLVLLAAIGSPDYAALAALLSVMVGIVLIGSALLRAGWIADLLSIPVTAGFMAGIAVHIIVGQLPSVLGVPDTHGTLPTQTVELLHRLPGANPYALGIGLFVLVATQASERVAKRLPGALLALMAVTITTAALHLEQQGVSVLGALSATRPRIALPTTKLGDILQICATGADRGAGLHDADGCRAPGLPVASRGPASCGARLRRHRGRLCPGRADRRLRGQCQPAAHGRRGLGGRRLPGGVIGCGGTRRGPVVRRRRANRVRAARCFGRYSDRGRAAHFPADRNRRYRPPRRLGDLAGGGQHPAGGRVADRDRHAGQHRPVVAAQFLYRGASALPGTGPCARHDGLVAAAGRSSGSTSPASSCSPPPRR